MPEPDDDSMLGEILGPMTWPKFAGLALLLAFIVGVCAICGWAPGWAG